VPSPAPLRERLAAGDVREAAHLARRHLLRDALPRVLEAARGEDVTDVPAELLDATLRLHGLARTPPDARAPVQRARRLLQRLVRELGVAPALGAAVRQALEASDDDLRAGARPRASRRAVRARAASGTSR
jgi:hypothetical protein